MNKKPIQQKSKHVSIKEAFHQHQTAKKAEIEKIKSKQKSADSKGFSRAFKVGLAFDGLE